MFTGEYRHKLDAKNRIFIPSKYREILGDEFFVVKSIRDNYIKVYTKEEWQKFIDKTELLEAKKREIALRSLNATAANVTPDDQGRILLPPHLVAHAQINKNAVILGCGKYAEIWAVENYDKFSAEDDPELVRQLLEEIGM